MLEFIILQFYVWLNYSPLWLVWMEYLENYDYVANSGQATILLRNNGEHFEFIFVLHLMKSILGDHKWFVTSFIEKDKDLENAMELVTFAKER